MNTRVANDVLLVGPRRERLADAFARSGLEIDEAPSCLEALVRLARRSARVVVLPAAEIEGREEDAIRAIKDGRAGPQVLVTAPRGRYRIPEEITGFGADDALVEPYLPDDLLERVRLLLRRSEERQETGLSRTLPPAVGPRVLAGLISDLTDIGRTSPHLETVVDKVIEVFEQRTGARRISLLLYDRKANELVLRKAIGLPPGVTVDTRVPMGWGVAGRCASRREPILVRSFDGDSARDLSNRGPYRTGSCLALPLAVANHLVGVLNLADKQDGQSFGQDDLDLLSPLAAQAAQAIDTALRFRRLKALSIIDDLTGLYNRRHFRRTLEREFRRASRHDHPLALAILDLDHFKVYNDQNGHEAGNRALRQLAGLLRRGFRATDTVARYGGEEFAVIFPETAKEGAWRVLERLRAKVEGATFEGEAALPLGRVTISGGVASCPADARDADALLEAADGALYAAKDQGRNRILRA